MSVEEVVIGLKYTPDETGHGVLVAEVGIGPIPASEFLAVPILGNVDIERRTRIVNALTSLILECLDTDSSQIIGPITCQVPS